MEIRPAQESDADLAITFLRDYRGEGLHTILKHGSRPDRQNQEEFIRSHDGDAGIMLLCVKNGKIVGSLTAMKKQHPQLEHSCEFGMGVLKEERGGGIGTALIHHLFEWARKMNIFRIELSVAGHNTGAIRLYFATTLYVRRKGCMPKYIAIFNDPRIVLALVIVALLIAFGVGWRLMVTLIAFWLTAVIIIIFTCDISVDSLFQGRKPPEIDTDKWVAAHTILFVWELLLFAFAIARLKMRRSALLR